MSTVNELLDQAREHLDAADDSGDSFERATEVMRSLDCVIQAVQQTAVHAGVPYPSPGVVETVD